MGRAHEKSSQSMLLFLMQKNQITCIKNEVMVILLIEKVIDNKMFPKSTAGLYISDSYQRNFISHRHRIFYGLDRAAIFVSVCSFTCAHRSTKYTFEDENQTLWFWLTQTGRTKFFSSACFFHIGILYSTKLIQR